MKEAEKNFQIFKDAIKKRIRLLIILIPLAGILAYVLTSPLVMTPLYSSTVILYPSVSLSGGALRDQEPRFGSDRDTREYLELSNSIAIRDSLTKAFNLFEHYDIDPDSEQGRFQLNRVLNNRFKVERTINNSLHITVLDAEPQIAADIANYVPDVVDDLRFKLFRRSYKTAYENAKTNFHKQVEEVNALKVNIEELRNANIDQNLGTMQVRYNEKSNKVGEINAQLQQIREDHGIFDIEEQINLLYEVLVDAQAEYHSDSGHVVFLKSKNEIDESKLRNAENKLSSSRMRYMGLNDRLKNLTSSAREYSQLQTLLEVEKERLKSVQSDYEEALDEFYKVPENLELTHLIETYENEFEMLKHLRGDYIIARNNYEQDFIGSYIVSPGQPSSRPDRPQPVFWSLISMFMTGFLLITWGFFVERRDHTEEIYSKA